MIKSFFGYFCFLSLIIMSGCASITGYQDGKGIGKNRIEGAISLNVSRSPDFISEEFEEEPNNDGITFPNVELFGRYGITDKIDIGAKLNSTLNFGLTSKFQLLGDRQSKTALAVGADLGTFGLIANLWNVQLPLYLSVHPSSHLSVYFSPRYIVQFAAADLSSESLSYLGGNTGILVGSKHKFAIDVGYYNIRGLSLISKDLFTIGVGGKFLMSGGDDDDYEEEPKPTRKKRRRK